MKIRRLLFALFLGISHVSSAKGTSDEAATEAPGAAGNEAPRSYIGLRVGASSGITTGQPEVCGELTPFAFLSIHACGSGAGLWSSSNGREISHYRLDWHLPSAKFGGVFVKALVGAGLAELQLTSDDPGFKLASTGPRGVETAGPEFAGILRAVLPLEHGFEGIADLTAGLAYFAHAPALVTPQARVQPFVGVNVGLAF